VAMMCTLQALAIWISEIHRLQSIGSIRVDRPCHGRAKESECTMMRIELCTHPHFHRLNLYNCVYHLDITNSVLSGGPGDGTVCVCVCVCVQKGGGGGGLWLSVLLSSALVECLALKCSPDCAHYFLSNGYAGAEGKLHFHSSNDFILIYQELH